MNQRDVEAFVRRKYALRADNRGESITAHVMSLYDAFGPWADKEFDQALLGGSDNEFIQRYWEMLLANHLTMAGHVLNRKSAGPDFSFYHQGRRVCVEATAPSATDDIKEFYREEARRGSSYFCATPFHLRWTQAINDKAEKFVKYLRDGRVDENDVLVIAVNASLLGAEGMTGQTKYPAFVEVAYGTGAEYVSIDCSSWAVIKQGFREEPNIRKHNGSLVPKRFFRDREFSHISAIFASGISPSQRASLCVAYNPLATVRLEQNYLAADLEYVAEPRGDGHEIIVRSSTHRKV